MKKPQSSLTVLSKYPASSSEYEPEDAQVHVENLLTGSAVGALTQSLSKYATVLDGSEGSSTSWTSEFSNHIRSTFEDPTYGGYDNREDLSFVSPTLRQAKVLPAANNSRVSKRDKSDEDAKEYDSFILRDINSRTVIKSGPNKRSGLFRWERTFSDKSYHGSKRKITDRSEHVIRFHARRSKTIRKKHFLGWKLVYRRQVFRLNRIQVDLQRRKVVKEVQILRSVFHIWKQRQRCELQPYDSGRRQEECTALLREAFQKWRKLLFYHKELSKRSKALEELESEEKKLVRSANFYAEMQLKRALSRWKLEARLSKIRSDKRVIFNTCAAAHSLAYLFKRNKSCASQSKGRGTLESRKKKACEFGKVENCEITKGPANSASSSMPNLSAKTAATREFAGIEGRRRARAASRAALRQAYSRKTEERQAMAREDENSFVLREKWKKHRLRLESSRLRRYQEMKRIEAKEKQLKVGWHQRRALLWYTGLKPWKEYIVIQRKLHIHVQTAFELALVSRYFRSWLSFISGVRDANRSKELRHLSIARQHRNHKLKIKGWKAVSRRYVRLRAKATIVTQREARYNRKRSVGLLRSAYAKKQRLRIRVDRCEAFYRLRRSWQSWKALVSIVRKQRLLELEKQQTWSKVRMWLAEAEDLSPC